MHQDSAAQIDYLDYLEPRFRLRQAAVAADFPPNTLRSYYQRSWFRSLGNGMGQGKGRAQRLCLGDILVLAITSRLVTTGRSPVDAFSAAYAFGVVAHTPKGLPRRMPFQLFDRGDYDTLFVINAGAAARVIPVKKGEDVSRSDLQLDDEFGDTTTVMSLNAVERTVFQHLGLSLPERTSGR